MFRLSFVNYHCGVECSGAADS